MTLIAIEFPECPFPKISNETLLEISLFLFFTFAMAEMVGAYLSSSLSMLGDASCTSIDVFTYICNAYVEWLKGRYGRLSQRLRYVVDVYVPVLSVAALLGITAYVTIDAVSVLTHPPSQDTVDVSFLYGFSAANFLIDLFCCALFLFRNDVFHDHHKLPQLPIETDIYDDDREFGCLEDEIEGVECKPPAATSTTPSSSSCWSCQWIVSLHHLHHTAHAPGHRKNLNMLTAFAHVVGDTLRTVAMFLAALISSLSGIDGDICDAWAAVLVALSIVWLCWPLIVEIREAALQIEEDEEEEDEVELRPLAPSRQVPHNRREQSARPYTRLNLKEDLQDEALEGVV